MASIVTNIEVIERPSVSSKSSSGSGTPTIKHSGNRLLSKLFGNKSSATKEPLIEETSNQPTPRPSQPEQFPSGLITPCPFIRPLEHRLQARNEPMGALPGLKKKARSFDTLSTSNSSAFQIAMNREKAHRMLDNTIAAQDNDEGVADLLAMDSVTDLSTSGYQEETKEDMDVQIFRQLQYVAATAAVDAQYTHHWGYYIQCYAKGHFNLNHLPAPPPCSPSFKYLPSVYPPQEEARIIASRSYDVVWPHWSKGKASALISAAMKEFDACFASLSFFDGKYEIFKAEIGYNASRISRSVSIASHALLSTDVLVVLDTKQDWRFEGNPLVCHNPKIRFFAGAPMLSPDGHPVGVFAIFGKKPRATFNADQRRELAGYSAMALKDISQQAIWHSDSDLQSLRSTPLLERDSDHRPSKKTSPTIDTDHNLVPPGLRYHKVKTPPTDTSRVFLNRHLSSDVLSEQTPPSSSEGSADDTFPGNPKGFGKNHKQLSVNADANHVSSSSYGELITPDSEGFRISTPRPFSASDLTSLNPHPPNTPVLLSQDASFHNNFDLTVENFMSLSDNDCAEQESPLIDLSTPQEVDKSETGESQTVAIPPASRLTFDSISTAMTDQSRDKKDPMADAAFYCAEIAQKLSYDLIYVVEIKPSRPDMTDEELLAPEGLQKKILVAYGLHKPLDLRNDVHINSLRSRGEIIWETPSALYEMGDCRSCFWISMQTEGGPMRQRTSGLVFGAFRLPKLVEDGVRTPDISTDEVKELKDAIEILKRILNLNQPNGRISPKKSNSEPSSPKRHAANEAVRSRRHLLDKTPEPYSAKEAVAVGSYYSAKNAPVLEEGYPAGEATEVGRFLRDQSPDQATEAVDVVTTSLESPKSHAEPPSPPAKPKRLTKSSKSSRSSKDKAVETQQISIEAGLDRPFHAIARFRAF